MILNEYGRWERLYRIHGSYSHDVKTGAVYAENAEQARALLGGTPRIQVIASGEVIDFFCPKVSGFDSMLLKFQNSETVAERAAKR